MELPNNIEQLSVEQLREIANAQLLIISEDSGYGFGVCAAGGMMAWNMMQPESPDKDWKSIVALQAPLTKYTKDELMKILQFAKIATDEYDSRFRYRMGANIHIFNKLAGMSANLKEWFYKRLTYMIGNMLYESLDELFRIMVKNHELPLESLIR